MVNCNLIIQLFIDNCLLHLTLLNSYFNKLINLVSHHDILRSYLAIMIKILSLPILIKNIQIKYLITNLAIKFRKFAVSKYMHLYRFICQCHKTLIASRF